MPKTKCCCSRRGIPPIENWDTVVYDLTSGSHLWRDMFNVYEGGYVNSEGGTIVGPFQFVGSSLMIATGNPGNEGVAVRDAVSGVSRTLLRYGGNQLSRINANNVGCVYETGGGNVAFDMISEYGDIEWTYDSGVTNSSNSGRVSAGFSQVLIDIEDEFHHLNISGSEIQRWDTFTPPSSSRAFILAEANHCIKSQGTLGIKSGVNNVEQWTTVGQQATTMKLAPGGVRFALGGNDTGLIGLDGTVDWSNGFGSEDILAYDGDDYTWTFDDGGSNMDVVRYTNTTEDWRIEDISISRSRTTVYPLSDGGCIIMAAGGIGDESNLGLYRFDTDGVEVWHTTHSDVFWPGSSILSARVFKVDETLGLIVVHNG